MNDPAIDNASYAMPSPMYRHVLVLYVAEGMPPAELF
jgi:hypothetical protein